MPRKKTAERGYGARWQKYRIKFLSDHPLCKYCSGDGRATPATVVDHIRPHRGNQAVFWDLSNHQALCKPCHDRHKAKEEHDGHSQQIGPDGLPVDPQHPFNLASKGRGVVKNELPNAK